MTSSIACTGSTCGRCGCGRGGTLLGHVGLLGHCWVLSPCRRTRREQECPHYERDDWGKHVRCHFNDVPRLEKQLQILVRGTSQRATIPCSDRTVELSEIGEYRSRTRLSGCALGSGMLVSELRGPQPNNPQWPAEMTH